MNPFDFDLNKKDLIRRIKAGSSLRLLLFVLTAILLLGQGFAIAANTPADKAPFSECKESPCIPSVLIYSDRDDGDTKVLIVDKRKQTAFLWVKNSQWQKAAQWTCSTGKLSGRKQIEGDMRTPEGIYFVLRKVPGRFLSETYGTRALPLDYPNWSDRIAKRGGSAIWLHGTNKPLKPLDSNGCIVFKNKSIDELSHWILPKRTPVILVDELHWQSQGKAKAKARTVLPIINRWQQALLGGSYQRLKQWYAPKAAPSMDWWNRWCHLRNKNQVEQGSFHGLIKNRLVLDYHDQLIVIFDHYLQYGETEFWSGRVRMYLDTTAYRAHILRTEYLNPQQAEITADKNDPLFHAWERMAKLQFTSTLQKPGGARSPAAKAKSEAEVGYRESETKNTDGRSPRPGF